MTTLSSLMTDCIKQFQEQGSSNFIWKVEEIIANGLNTPRKLLSLKLNDLVSQDVVDVVYANIRRVFANEPIEYILGSVQFMDCNIKVTPDVLIPRPETEVLVEIIINDLTCGLSKSLEIWDVCTGSGCIGLSLAKHFPTSIVTLSDISNKSLSIAKHNAQINNLKVNYMQGDLLAPFYGKKADVVVCNPPYISHQELADLDSSVRDFEPHLALVAGDRGYSFYERLAQELPDHLNKNAKIFLEIGSTQAEELKAIFSSSHWASVECKKDYSGLDRFFSLEFSP